MKGEKSMIEGLYEAHLPVRNLEKSIVFYEGLGLELSHIHEDRLAFFWIKKNHSWLGLWESDKAELAYHPSIRHIAFQVSLENLKGASQWLKNRGYQPREAFGFEPHEAFVMAHDNMAHAKIHFNDIDGNSLELITKLENPNKITGRMYLSEWEKKNQ
jgi:catechol 2,3-dioxygenase-like lactoylglutathione lyase family enzyme